jgi:hypothetical protein
MALLETTRSRTPANQWYDAERSPVMVDDLAARQTTLLLDKYMASAPGDSDGENA